MQTIHKGLLLGLVAVITVVFFRSQGTHDLDTWLTWGKHAYEHGIVDGYAMDGNLYPPLADVLIWLSYSLAMLIGIAPVYTIKFSLLIFLLVTTTIFYHWSNKNTPATLCFYSAMLVSSLGLAYLDIYFAPALLFSLYRLQQGKISQFLFFFTLACLIKFPPLMIAPFFLIYIISHHWRKKQTHTNTEILNWKSLAPAFGLLIVILFLFGKTLVLALLKATQAPWLSAWALNFNWIVTRIFLQNGWGQAYPPGLDPNVAIMNPVPKVAQQIASGLYLFFFSEILLLFILRKKTFEKLLLTAMLGSFSYFMFSTGVHENHLFLASLLAMALFCINPKFLYLGFGILLISSLNMFVFYGVSGNNTGGFLFHENMSSPTYSYWTDAPLLIAYGNVIYFLVLWFCTALSLWREKPVS